MSCIVDIRVLPSTGTSWKTSNATRPAVEECLGSLIFQETSELGFEDLPVAPNLESTLISLFIRVQFIVGFRCEEPKNGEIVLAEALFPRPSFCTARRPRA
jgi:hypothetical protein